MLDGVLESLALPLDTAFHLLSKLLIDFEVLDLQFAVSLLLRVDQLRGHIELQVGVIIVFCGRGYRVQGIQMRYAFSQVLLKPRLLDGSCSQIGLVGEVRGPLDCLRVVLQARLAQVHGRRGRASHHLFVTSENILDTDVLQLT